ncbi:hypothetical protein LCGC14_0494900 [marine sediment metagenome]|uniref:Uncharacterized protein n=1 Tax=marine sediment metagenome TaxID=412755 RepID=A0A0F9VE29_9ZZZZ
MNQEYTKDGLLEVERHKIKDVLRGRLNHLNDMKKAYENAHGELIEAIDNITEYLEAITEDSEFKVIID